MKETDIKPNMFDGATYDPKLDYVRMKGQILRVFELMKDGKRRTVRDIAAITGDPETSISTRLRDFRKAKFGGHTLDKERVAGGLYVYWLTVNEEPEQTKLL